MYNVIIENFIKLTKTHNFSGGRIMITKDTFIGDILNINPETAPFFLEMGMHCLGCPAARSETVEQACEVHGVDCDELVEKINDFLAEN